MPQQREVMEAQVEQALEQAIRLQAQADSDQLCERKSLSVALKVMTFPYTVLFMLHCCVDGRDCYVMRVIGTCSR